MKIQYDNVLVQGQELTKDQTKNKPVFEIPTGMFLIMFDPDAPTNQKGKAWIHWIVDSYGKEYLPYHPPTPPTGTHRYIFRLLDTMPTIPTKRNSQNVPEGSDEVFFTVTAQLGGKKKRKTKKLSKRRRL